MKLVFLQERETKNTVRYAEQPEPGKPTVVGVLYVQKFAAVELGESIVVTIEKK